MTRHHRVHVRAAATTFQANNRRQNAPPPATSAENDTHHTPYPTQDNTPSSSANSNVADSQQCLGNDTANIFKDKNEEHDNNEMFNVEQQEARNDEDHLFQNNNIRNPDAPNPSSDIPNEFQRIQSTYSNEKWDEFEDLLSKYNDFDQNHVGIKKRLQDSTQKNSKFNPKDPAKIQ